MPERIANTFVLVEDVVQQNLIRRYLQQCRGASYSDGKIRWWPLAASRGCGEQHVRREFPRVVQACRSSVGKRTSALLVVMIDADREPTEKRVTRLAESLRAAGRSTRTPHEPIAVLIPKRHVETWIRALLGNSVDEATDYTSPKPTANQLKSAAESLHQWARPGTAAGRTSPFSLTASFPDWRKID